MNRQRFTPIMFGILAISVRAITAADETRKGDLLIVGRNESAYAAAVQTARPDMKHVVLVSDIGAAIHCDTLPLLTP